MGFADNVTFNNALQTAEIFAAELEDLSGYEKNEIFRIFIENISQDTINKLENTLDIII
jgi:hypothetical protein